MSQTWNNVLPWIREATREAESASSDAQLLERFVHELDPTAFEALLRRHGAMVLGVCRRVLRSSADAEDAFQATFLVLLRKAHTVIPKKQLAGWLSGVAYKTALKALEQNRRRTEKETRAASVKSREVHADDSEELREFLDGELARLPEQYRSAVVLCDLEEVSLKEAAHRLGCPTGTVASRLARGRALLARGLKSRGVVASVAGIGSLVGASTVSASLAGSTSEAALAVATNQPLAECVSAKVTLLMEGVLSAMTVSRSKLVLALALFLLGGVTPLLWLIDRPGSADPLAVRAAPVPGARNLPPLDEITWKNEEFRRVTTLKLWPNGKYQLIETKRTPVLKNSPKAKPTKDNPPPPLGPGTVLPNQPRIEYQQDGKPRIAIGKFQVQSLAHQVIVLDDGDETRGFRLYHQGGRNPKWSFDEVAVRREKQIGKNHRERWHHLGNGLFALTEELAGHPSEISLRPLLLRGPSQGFPMEPKSRVPQSTLGAVRRLLPRHWSANIVGNSLVIARDDRVFTERLPQPNPPGIGIDEPRFDPLVEIDRERFIYRLYFVKRLTNKEWMDRLVKNGNTKAQMKKMRETEMRAFTRSRRGQIEFDPKTPAQKKLLEKYRGLEASIYDLPDLVDDKSSVYWEQNFSDWSTPATRSTIEEVKGVEKKLHKLFESYPTQW